MELVGKDKIQKKLGQLEHMKGASLSYGGVSSVGNINGVMPGKIFVVLSFFSLRQYVVFEKK